MCSKKPAAFCAGDIHLRALGPEDWEIFRAMRVKAVEMHTGYFLSTPEETRGLRPEHWKATLDSHGKQVFGLFNQKILIGITAVFTWREDPSGETGVMAMSFIESEYRGNGYSAWFYKARLDFAKQHLAWKKLHIGHREGNEPSRRAMIKHGFEFTKTEEIDWPDGTRDVEYLYELDLEKLRS